MLGITGPPGAGKSTVAERVIAALGERARLVPMDGFHLAGAELDRLGRRERKGAPDTFDAEGYVALLARLRETAEAEVLAPAFSRVTDEPVADAIAIPRGVALVVTEGNYLLLEGDPWAAVGGLLDEVWYVEADEAERIERLIARHVKFGKSPDAARAWALGPDQRNAERVAFTRERADLVITS